MTQSLLSSLSNSELISDILCEVQTDLLSENKSRTGGKSDPKSWEHFNVFSYPSTLLFKVMNLEMTINSRERSMKLISSPDCSESKHYDGFILQNPNVFILQLENH